MIEYKCNNISSSISNIKVSNYKTGSIEIIYKDSDEVYSYSGIEMDKLVDLERCYRHLTSKKYAESRSNEGYSNKWSIGKFLNKEIINNDNYKVKNGNSKKDI